MTSHRARDSLPCVVVADLDGGGAEVVAGKCSICHSLDRIAATHATENGWEKIVKDMVNEGAPLEDGEIPVVVKYLVKNFGPAD